ncbi:hypothetical protein C0Z16_03910 [Paraburkholderia rhynchosiae]|uniref:Uncharacterized protein n=1 Tax=Paraburkholderia rhynchosiae TaxID=487049 RepID=A0ABX4VEA3_9BURK|nr:hypothetical protein C0Z16_03910 [Paraburkholderia rhynchosiae]
MRGLYQAIAHVFMAELKQSQAARDGLDLAIEGRNGDVARNEGQTLRRPCEQGNTLLTVRFAGNATLAAFSMRGTI